MTSQTVTGSRLTGYIVNVMRSPVIERLMVRGSQVALKHVIHDMEANILVMELRRRAIKRWVHCGDMDRKLKIPHSAKAECGFRTTPEECLYDSGPIGPSVKGLIIQYYTIQCNCDVICIQHYLYRCGRCWDICCVDVKWVGDRTPP